MGGGDTEQTTKVELSKEQRKLLGLAMPFAEQFAASPPQAVPIQPFDPLQQQAQNQAVGAAGTQNDLASKAASGAGFMLDGSVLDVNRNPGLKGAIDAAVRPILGTLNQSTLPALRGNAITAGGYGGSRQGIAEGLAVQGAQQAMGDVGSKIAFEGYNSGLDAMNKAQALTPTLQSAQTAGASTLDAVGAQRRAMQEALAGNVNQETMMNLLAAKELASLVGGIPGGSTTTSASGGSSGLSSALGLAGLGLSLFGGPLGAAMGGGMGGLMGGMGGMPLNLLAFT